jgi:phage terminase small subunit
MALSLLQQRFVEEYLVDLNASAAYQRAGYKARGHAAETNAARLLRNAEVKSAIHAAQQVRSQRTEITADRVLQELALVGFSDIGQILDFSGNSVKLRPGTAIPEQARRLLSSVKVKRYFEGTSDEAREVEITEFKIWDKLSALEKIGKHLGMFKELHEHTGKDGEAIQVQVYLPDNGRDAHAGGSNQAGSSSQAAARSPGAVS